MSNINYASVLFDIDGEEISLSPSSVSTSAASWSVQQAMKQYVNRAANAVMYNNDSELDKDKIEDLIYQALPKLKPGMKLYGTSALKHQPIIDIPEELFEL